MQFKLRDSKVIFAVIFSAALLVGMMCLSNQRKHHDQMSATEAENAAAPRSASANNREDGTAGHQRPDNRDNLSPSSSSSASSAITVPVPLESTLVSGNALNADATNKLLAQKDFDAVLNTIALQSDANGAALTKAYQKALVLQLSANTSRFSLDRLTCGTTICGAVFSGAGKYDQFSEVMDTASSSGAKMYSASVYTLAPSRPGDPLVYRVIFATDPKYSAITVPKDALQPKR